MEIIKKNIWINAANTFLSGKATNKILQYREQTMDTYQWETRNSSLILHLPMTHHATRATCNIEQLISIIQETVDWSIGRVLLNINAMQIFFK